MVWTFNGIYINGLTLWLLCKEDNLHSFTNIFLYLKFNHNLNIPLCSQNHFNFYIYPIGVFTIQNLVWVLFFHKSMFYIFSLEYSHNFHK
jgi:hypothetical protein